MTWLCAMYPHFYKIYARKRNNFGVQRTLPSIKNGRNCQFGLTKKDLVIITKCLLTIVQLPQKWGEWPKQLALS